ncbi:arginase family protein [Thalassotalea sp. 1_MG-2023]|uniref:arginase family protein n=1 Tax=Thalassotalea sp. 1_MG-2023 TaxID=3062680 RepID=UPI0026E249B7|nr:arginase family protein [Thalassotalea sp. 1_MG-2023]MDO6427846.1 arginase family protein [Thalassotalea sp. 1_MG-2023]
MTTHAAFLQKIQQSLCPPGNGVFTVNTAKERKEQLHQKLFGTTENIEQKWQESLQGLTTASKAVVLGIASDCGGGILRGANWGPLFVRSALLEHHPESVSFDLGDVRVIPHLLHDKYLNEGTITSCRKALYNDEHSPLAVSPLTITEDVLHDFYTLYPEKGIFGIGGDHSNSYPLTKAYLQAKKKQGKRAAIIHFDAHTDLLVERLGIDLCFGSWCTHILNDLHDPSHLIQLGIRSSGKPKSHWESTFGVQQHWAHEIIERGVDAVLADIISHLKSENIEELYVSFDIDALDQSFAAATGTPEPDGLSPEQAINILTTLAEQFAVTGADMMEIAPFTDSTGQGNASAQTTLKHGADISAVLIEAMGR